MVCPSLSWAWHSSVPACFLFFFHFFSPSRPFFIEVLESKNLFCESWSERTKPLRFIHFQTFLPILDPRGGPFLIGGSNNVGLAPFPDSTRAEKSAEVFREQKLIPESFIKSGLHSTNWSVHGGWFINRRLISFFLYTFGHSIVLFCVFEWISILC